MIELFDTYKEQLDMLKIYNYGEDNYSLYLSSNRQNKEIKTSEDCVTDNMKIYYADKDHNALSEYLPLDHNYEHPEFFVFPKEAVYLDYFNTGTNNLIRSKEIKNKIEQEPIYRIGLMSDVHYNDYDTSDQDPDTGSDDGAEYSEDLINALTYFKSQNVDFIACSGDISTDDPAHISNYKYCCDKYAPETSIFTCSGNHDTKPKYISHDLWNSISAIDRNNEYDIHYFDDNEPYNGKDESDGNTKGTSFYFKKYYNNKTDNFYDIFIFLNVEYGWNNPDNYHTHDADLLSDEDLLVHTEVDTYNDLHLYHPKTLQCLADILEENKGHRCFIFTHLMLPDKAGNYHNWNNLMTNNDSYYPYANYGYHSDVLRGDQGEFIENLMKKYPNNFWFCGHSHYKWLWEKYDHNINVTKTGDSYNVHIPSLSRPLPIEIRSYHNAPKDSEAGILEIYNNYVVLKGVVMKEESDMIDTGTDQIVEYPDELLTPITEDMFSWYEGNPNVSISQEDDTIILNVKYYQGNNNDENNIYLNNGVLNARNFGNYIPVLRFSYLQILNSNGEDITESIQEEAKVGFRDHTSSSDYLYYFESNHIYTTYAKGLVLKIGSDSSFKNETLTIKMKAKLGFIHEGYKNKFLPIALFKMNTK